MTLKPGPTTWVASLPVGHYRLHQPSPFVINLWLSPKARYSFYSPTKGRKRVDCSEDVQSVLKAVCCSGFAMNTQLMTVGFDLTHRSQACYHWITATSISKVVSSLSLLYPWLTVWVLLYSHSVDYCVNRVLWLTNVSSRWCSLLCRVAAVHSSTLSIGSNSSAYSTVGDVVDVLCIFIDWRAIVI